MTYFRTVLVLILMFQTAQITARWTSVAAGNDIDDLRDDSNADPFGNNEILDDFESEETSKSDDSKCAYTTIGGVSATPLGSCCNFEQTQTSQTSYSYDFTTSGLSISWNYYNGLDCKEASISTTMSSIHQSEGSGSNCDIVRITKSGSFSKNSDECILDETTQSDYYSMSYVINECIQTSISGQDLSVIMFCDSEKLYFNQYSYSTECQGDVEQYVYHYFDDDDCWDIECDSMNQQLIEMENGIEDPERIKRYIFESVMLANEYHVINGAKNQYGIPWMVVVVILVFLLSIGLVIMHCYSIKNKDNAYMPIN